MREIKFRVWGGQKMEYGVVAGALGNFYAGGMNPNDSASLGNTTKYSDQAPLMQYTGLKDKNGKEIYEGDIAEYLGIAKGTRAVVEYRLGCGPWVNLSLLSDTPRFNCYSKTVKVVGNIYEHPHLLSHEK